MCIIVYKPAGVKMPSGKVLSDCYSHNHDGAGYMLPKGGMVSIRKGFMKYADFKAAIDSEGDLTEVPVVMHFRITTQGGVQRGLCHPFPVCGSYKHMLGTEQACNVAVAHNGIITHCSSFKVKDHNDTMEWIKRFADPVIANDPNWSKSSKKVRILKDPAVSGGYNKFAIMSRNGHVVIIGDFVKDGGCWFSNSSYKSDYGAAKTCFVSSFELACDWMERRGWLDKGAKKPEPKQMSLLEPDDDGCLDDDDDYEMGYSDGYEQARDDFGDDPENVDSKGRRGR
ncbi:MAG: hypothetical protein LKG11_00765 [Bacilli bacterium]|jgi:hypothetical protein|nr:hypothetical protein [Bacilli bacterium]